MNQEQIIDVKDVGFEETYDLEVEHDSHTFFANGISVSNSHSTSYCITSFMCAKLLNYYPLEYIISYLEKENDDKKETILSLVKKNGIEIEPININVSSKKWKINEKKENSIIQPFSSIKGIGETAIEQIMRNRPFNTIEELIFNENISYNKLNKRHLEVLAKSGALDILWKNDGRFNHLKHFWLSCIYEKPLNEKKLVESIKKYSDEKDFTNEEKIQFVTDITGVYPIELVVDETLLMKLKNKNIPPISEYDAKMRLCWGIVKDVEIKYTKTGKPYFFVEMIDSNYSIINVRCWGIVKQKDKLYLNHPYMIKLDYNEQWGFSTHSMISKNWKMIG